MRTFSVAIVGATGLVGTTLLALFAEKSFPIDRLVLLASQQSAGKSMTFNGQPILIEALEEADFTGIDFAFFCVSNVLASEYAPIAAKAGAIVIDKSYFYRNHPDVPLVIPEVNSHHLQQFKNMNIIASPNCNTIPIAVAIKPIADAVGLQRLNIATYQSVSGTGKEAIAELYEQSLQVLQDQPITSKVYPQQIAFNLLPHIDAFEENGYTLEEMKMVWELRKIFEDASLKVNPTAVRVPVVCGHSIALHIETQELISLEHAKALLSSASGVVFMDHGYPTPVKDGAGSDSVYVGRLRKDLSHDRGLNLWVVADNLRKGAALNAIQIAESLIKDYL